MDIISVYNPANAGITQEETAQMQDLTDEQITQLAKAYPNNPRGNAYLVYWNKSLPLEKQLYPLGTWQNLANLRKLGRKEILAHGFYKTFFKPKLGTKPIAVRTVDLTKDEASKAEGLKSSVEQRTPVGQKVELIAKSKMQKVDKVQADIEGRLAKAKTDRAHPAQVLKIEKELAAYLKGKQPKK